MFPELLTIGPISIKSYGFFIAIGFLAALYFTQRRAKKEALNLDIIMDLNFYLLISGIIGARVLYVILSWDYYRNNLIEILYVWSGGLVLYGGVITGLLASIYYVKKNKLNYWQLADIFIAPAFLWLAIGRIGCLCAGCCYGKPATGPLGIVFSNPKSFAPLNILLIPTQIYESLFCFTLFLAGQLFYGRKKFHGQVFMLSTMLYCVWRFIIEFYRGDDRGMFLFTRLYPSQTLSIVIFALLSGALIYLWKKNLK
ncbi:MAG: prolipoprotein diacylglyceryl transferase [Elusimicrobia bacterium RIFOXYA2_FULL_39_19]|nr:MAG: prolipoprotein diacylglyceryl transferase [Elusimicrobia bacterium RIFOXYA2_FULL_39_19]